MSHIIEYIVSSKYIEGDKLSGKDLKIFSDKKKAIKYCCKLMILAQGEKVYEVWKELSKNGLIVDKEMVFTTEVDFSTCNPHYHMRG